MRIIVRNALIGATVASVLATALLLAVDHRLRDALSISPLAIHPAAAEELATDILYMWSAATVGAVIYGILAQRLGIYGLGSNVLRCWKNALLGLPIIAGIALLTQALLGESRDITAPLFVAMGLAVSISDAGAPRQRW